MADRIDDDPVDDPTKSNDALSMNVGAAGVWSLPGDEGLVGQSPAMLRPPAPTPNTYPEGIFVGSDTEEDAQSDFAPDHWIKAYVDAPKSYELPHEAMHRRFEPPRIVPIAQTAPGTLMFAPVNFGLHIVKLLALCIGMAANGTVQFVQGSNDGLSTAPIGTQGGAGASGMGAMAIGGNVPLVLPPAELANPWMWTAPDQALGLVSATSFVNGWAIIAYSPYDS